jgi:hypothetical protein
MENTSDDLALVAEARAAAADRLTTPWWYHPTLGLFLAAYVVSQSLGNAAVRTIAVVLFVAACAALVRAYRRLTGVWVSGFEAGPASRWAKALGAVAGLVLTAGWGLAYWADLTWPAWCLAAVAFIAVQVLGRQFDRALRAQLRAGV